MTALSFVVGRPVSVIAWGLCATVAAATMMEGSQIIGISRMSLPFLFGTFFVGDRRKAMWLGYLVYVVGGWLFAILYALLFGTIGMATWWLGAVFGLAHAFFLIIVLLPAMEHFHPRMTSTYDGPTELKMLEPPGPLGLHYGWGTPLATTIAQVVFGMVLGAGLQLR